LVKPAPGTVGTTELSGGTVTTTADATINGVTVGKGGGNVSNNTAVGYQALLTDTNGLNTAVGYQAAKTVNSGGTVTAVGYQAGTSVTTGDLTAVGYQAGKACTTPNFNVAVGNNSLPANITGAYNTAIGAQSLYSNTTGSNNTAVGYQALYTQSAAGQYNTAVGYQAGRSTTTGTLNSIFGHQGGYSLTTGSQNAFFGGVDSGYYVTTGSQQTIIGNYNGNQNTLDMRTSNNVIVVSAGDGIPRFWYQSSNFIIVPVGPTGVQYTFDSAQFYSYPDNTAKLGYPSYRWTTVYAVTGTINTSDANQKQQIRSLDDSEKAVAIRIKSLIKAFKFNDSVTEKGDDARIHVGVIAQDVQAAFIAEGLDPSKYGMFCSDTWYEVDGKKSKPSDPYTAETEGAVLVTQLGIRYDQLLSFVISAL
jgi:hypothetical protein